MFIILSYDVGQKRVGKVLKTCRKYLTHVQKSVFEGIITEGKLCSLKNELKHIVDAESDSICVYSAETSKLFIKEQLGTVEQNCSII